MFRNPLHKKLLKSIQLDTNTKQSIRDQLLLEIRSTEGFERNVDQTRLLIQKQPHHLFSPLTLFQKAPMPILAAIVALMLGTGTTFAAETSLPGDVLYPVKVGINEEVREAFAFSTEQKAHWELERANRRAAEAATLQAAEHMDESIRQRLANSMQANERKIENLMKKLEESGDEETAAMIQARLDHYLEIKTNILDGIKELQENQDNLSDDEQARRRAALLKQQEEYKDALERRREIIIQAQEKQEALMKRRRIIIEQQQEKQDALIERRHEQLQIQQEKQDALLERREEILRASSETETDTEIEVEIETETEVETEVEIETDTDINIEL